ncbi:manganese efflux pump MntP family protein [Bengtsoniella intestinalis]|uniref:manganese efflux pump MntP n=1 Tax=Bengtsoniella intestinalis TaxID=3073143 RepID=UPI00391F76B5
MSFTSLFLVGIGLSMDAFAAAICQGLSMGQSRFKHGLIVALFFGGFQGLMPWIGYHLGTHFAQAVGQVGHWISFALMVYLGAKMMLESRLAPDDTLCPQLDYAQLLGLSIATSLDALAVGVTFAFLQVAILPAVVIIALTTFILSFLGVMLGHSLGTAYRQKALLTGGLVLILLGCQIVLERFLNMK